MSGPAFEPVACVVASLFGRTASEELARQSTFRVYASELHARANIGASLGLTITPATLLPTPEYERLVRIAEAAKAWSRIDSTYDPKAWVRAHEALRATITTPADPDATEGVDA